MGNDGGSIPDRRDLVKNKPKAEQADKNNQTIAAWFFCALSKRPLQEPIVSCALGKLYNKDALLEYLLDKSAYGDGRDICGHIKSIKEVKTLFLTHNPAKVTDEESPDTTRKRAPFICPLTLKEMSGSLPFVYLTTCGCVFSAAGLKAVSNPSSSSTTPPATDEDKTPEPQEACPQCAKPFTPSTDIRTLNPSPEESEKMRERMLASKAIKGKGKKRKVAVSADVGEDEEKTASGEPVSKRTKSASKTAESNTQAAAPSLNPSISSVARKVTEQLAEEEKRRKATMSSAVASLYAPKSGKKTKETFLTMGTFTRYA